MEKVRSKILIVDDSRSIRRALVNHLSALGYDVVAEDSGENAFRQLATFRPDCIVSDLEMPGMSGLEFCEKLKADQAFRNVPVIMLTSKDDIDSLKEGVSSGADDFISKKSHLDVLDAKIQALLRLQSLQAELTELRRVEAIKGLIVTYNHEFNNPLTILFGYTDRLIRKGAPEDRELHLKVRAQLERLKELVDKISEMKHREEFEEDQYAGGAYMLKVK